MTNPTPPETLLTFPCDFMIKVFGEASDDFDKSVLNIIREYVPSLSADSMHARQSENGKYRALSISIYVTSKKQLDDIYFALSSSPIVLMVL
jgi:putative lipoic acid-binding regulatory protein